MSLRKSFLKSRPNEKNNSVELIAPRKLSGQSFQIKNRDVSPLMTGGSKVGPTGIRNKSPFEERKPIVPSEYLKNKRVAVSTSKPSKDFSGLLKTGDSFSGNASHQYIQSSNELPIELLKKKQLNNFNLSKTPIIPAKRSSSRRGDDSSPQPFKLTNSFKGDKNNSGLLGNSFGKLSGTQVGEKRGAEPQDRYKQPRNDILLNKAINLSNTLDRRNLNDSIQNKNKVIADSLNKEPSTKSKLIVKNSNEELVRSPLLAHKRMNSVNEQQMLSKTDQGRGVNPFRVQNELDPLKRSLTGIDSTNPNHKSEKLFEQVDTIGGKAKRSSSTFFDTKAEKQEPLAPIEASRSRNNSQPKKVPRVYLNLDSIRRNERDLPSFESAKTVIKDFGCIKGFSVNTHQGTVRAYNEDRVSILLNAQQR
jgi:hypothetical protein